MATPVDAYNSEENRIRSQAILKDIHARHRYLRPDMSVQDKVKAIALNAIAGGLAPSAWASPEERAAARAAYAAKGGSEREKQARWEKSKYLLDPDTYKYMQGPGRDIDFLLAMHDAENLTEPPHGSSYERPTIDDMRHSAVRTAVRYWDEGNFEPLWRDSYASPNYQSQGNALSAVANFTQNPDTLSGFYLNTTETIPDRIRMGGSGEAATGEEAWEAAQAKRMALNRYRLSSPSPVLDFPEGAKPTLAEKAARIRELQHLTKTADVPEADQRWARWTKQNLGKSFVPPGWLTDSGDFALSWADPTAAIPVGGTAAGAAKIALKGAKVAGGGWVRPLLSGLLRAHSKDFAWDMGTELGVGHALSGGLGGKPSRTHAQYWLGNWSDPDQKTEEEVQQSRDARTALYEKLKDDDRVSRADKRAYEGVGIKLYTPYID